MRIPLRHRRPCSLPARLFLPTLLALLAGQVPAAHASDGTLEINQTCAVQTGCFSGDTAGFPVTINGSAGRSYRLTSDLVVPNENTDGIVVATSDVGIDLNDFTIIRSSCVGAITTCVVAAGSGSGVERSTFTSRGTSVHDGSVVGMGLYGIFLGEQGEVRNVRARWNRLDGINIANGSAASGNITFENGRFGIGASFGANVSDNVAYNNGNDGIFTSSGSTISGNTAYSNGGDGIQAGAGSTVVNSTCYQNSESGIELGVGAMATHNSVYNNNGGGIGAQSGSFVEANVLRDNSAYGIALGSAAVARDNVVSAVLFGAAVITGGVNGGGNYCNGSTTCD